MHLVFDDYGEFWVWVDDRDENIELSPQFDTKQDAINWQQHLKKIFTGKQ